MLLFHCPVCKQSFTVEDARISRQIPLNCPNCDSRVPTVALNAAKAVALLPKDINASGWEVTHLADSHFTSAVEVKTL